MTMGKPYTQALSKKDQIKFLGFLFCSQIYLLWNAVTLFLVDSVVCRSQFLFADLVMADGAHFFGNIFVKFGALFVGNSLANFLVLGLVLGLVHGRALLGVGGGALVLEDGLFDSRADLLVVTCDPYIRVCQSDKTEQNDQLK